ncbi:hypothetical protein HJB79_14435 [Rhizobium lentis]|uniref:hypothetical protein n=1 Tax=Rhizobium lentis TaxID=1138194 RepID=UPI001C83216B|nr:hypothetical protein [Rhizobium lentis]MBX5133823.1 hypothetical protein [Rhizobium lentis]MBX5139956.1 hypothetical protein [Rhizobium lentis]
MSRKRGDDSIIQDRKSAQSHSPQFWNSKLTPEAGSGKKEADSDMFARASTSYVQRRQSKENDDDTEF